MTIMSEENRALLESRYKFGSPLPAEFVFTRESLDEFMWEIRHAAFPNATHGATEMFVAFSIDGKHLRKWSSVPFEGAHHYVLSTLPEPSRVRGEDLAWLRRERGNYSSDMPMHARIDRLLDALLQNKEETK